jgi:hypothetical protein
MVAHVEVMLWDYSYAPDASIHWPKDWPALNSDRAMHSVQRLAEALRARPVVVIRVERCDHEARASQDVATLEKPR